MGTNYHIKENECKSCGRYEELHLGKSSAGWQFSFQYNGGRFYKNVKEMKKWLEGKVIWNEYDDKVSNEDFWKMVKAKQKEKLNHAIYMHQNYPSHTGEMIIDGYSFSDTEFS